MEHEGAATRSNRFTPAEGNRVMESLMARIEGIKVWLRRMADTEGDIAKYGRSYTTSVRSFADSVDRTTPPRDVSVGKKACLFI